MKKIILIVSFVVIAMIIYSLFNTENINSLEGDFEELAFIRNENNTGPIHRIYAYSVSDTIWSEMRKHTDLLPHTKYGTTEVYYFLSDQFKTSLLKLSMQGINKESKSFCILFTSKDGQARIKYEKYPFR